MLAAAISATEVKIAERRLENERLLERIMKDFPCGLSLQGFVLQPIH